MLVLWFLAIISLSWCLIWACFCCYKQHKAAKPLLVLNRLITNHTHSFLSNVSFNVIVSCILFTIRVEEKENGTFIVEGSIDIARIMWFEHVSCWSFWQIWLIRQKKEDTLLFLFFSKKKKRKRTHYPSPMTFRFVPI